MLESLHVMEGPIPQAVEAIGRRYGTRLRHALLYYVMGSMLFAQLLWVEEHLVGLGLPWWTVFAFGLVLVPVPAAVAGWLRAPVQDEDQSLSDFMVVVWTVVALVVWIVLYFGVGWLSYGRPMHTMHTVIDDLVPYVPETIFIYLTVYHVFVSGFLAQSDGDFARRLAVASSAMLLLDSTIMYLYPVSMARPDPAGPPLSRWFLSFIHGADPAHNCFPSSHCSVVMFAFVALWTTGHKKLAVYMGLSALAISISTLTTKQHYGVDVIAGWGTVLAVWGAFAYNGYLDGGAR